MTNMSPISGGSRGGTWGGPPPLIFRPNWGPKGWKKFFLETGPPLLSEGLDDCPPPLSEGLGPPLPMEPFTAFSHNILQKGRGGGGDTMNFNMGRLWPEVQPRTLLHTIFIEKVSLFYILINTKTRTFSQFFHSNVSVSIFEMTDFPTLSYTLTSEIPTLSYTWSLKKVLLLGGAFPYRPL